MGKVWGTRPNDIAQISLVPLRWLRPGLRQALCLTVFITFPDLRRELFLQGTSDTCHLDSVLSNSNLRNLLHLEQSFLKRNAQTLAPATLGMNRVYLGSTSFGTVWINKSETEKINEVSFES